MIGIEIPLQASRLSTIVTIPFLVLYAIACSMMTGGGTFVLAATSVIALGIFGSRKGLGVLIGFLPLLMVGAVFLTAIHGLEWSPFSIDYVGLRQAAVFLGRLVVVFSGISLLSACISRDEFFATLVLCRVPSAVIFGVFRAAWILSKMRSRASDILLAQRMRGVCLEGPLSKINAIRTSLHAMINSTLVELEASVFVLVSRGVFSDGPRVSLTTVRLGLADATYAALSTLGLALALALGAQGV